MAHFAEIGLNNVVLRVVVIGNEDCKDQFGSESEVIGAKFCNTLFGGVWLQTSYNGAIRKNYAGIDFTYSSQLDAFIPPKPFNSWVLDESICQWKAPHVRPVDDKLYFWDELTTSWKETIL